MTKYGSTGWAWKPDIYNPVVIQRQRRKDKKKRLAVKAQSISFYESDEWRQLRYKVLKRDKGRCLLCGRGVAENVILHVDHIKPRSKYPHLELIEDNLQTLCEDCNLGKSNIDETDWR